ncbi:hypothetical protein DV713_08565 [Parageobacillus thermoglucosidasius]|uniref:recombinase family protein n=1 Tax=Parageobacillus thermoglucosidasius TaxID=1426 RepID=UPI000E13F859|nr:recombinase family protein [Parageobacillus thermoglucosidasius]RDE34142.1 hypothetical protein DV713_08565 [Parageobacillus thermoglucosidasius]
MLNVVTKLKVLYMRVSSDNQSEEMQLNAAKRYLEQYNPDEVLILCDHGISATKLPLHKRPQLVKLLDLVREDKVDTLLVYQRDRLARDFYEYLTIISELIKHNVNVIFTASDSPQFNKDIVLEGAYAIFAQHEGHLINKRTSDARKQAPHRIFGYDVTKTENGRSYSINEKRGELVKQLFSEAANVENIEEFLILLTKYKKLVGRKVEDVLKILKQPFYAGYYMSQNEYHHLQHVPAIITLDEYKSVNKKLEQLEKQYYELKAQTQDSALIRPICFICNNEMSLKMNAVGTEGYFVCSRNHKLVDIPIKQLNDIIDEIVTEILNNLNINELEKKCLSFLTSLKKENDQDKTTCLQAIRNIEYKLCTTYNLSKPCNEAKKLMAELSVLESKLSNIVQKEQKINECLREINELVRLIQLVLQESLEGHERRLLAKMIIKNLIVHHEYVTCELFFHEFFKSEVLT